MVVVLILAVLFGVYILSLILSKKCSNILSEKGSAGKSVYIVITGIFSGFLYYSYSGFTLEINRATVLFAFIYGVCSMIAGITLTIYKYADVATVNVTKSSLSLILTSLVGFVIFLEPVTKTRIIKLALMLLVVFLVFLNGRKSTSDSENLSSAQKKKNFLKFLLLIAVQLPVFVFSAYQSKIVAKYDIIPDLNSYYCLTNVFMLFFGIVWIIYLSARDKESIKECLSIVKSKSLITMLLMLLNGTFSAILSIVILKYLDISVYSPLNSALSFIGASLVSLIFKEKLGKFIWIALGISIIAVII